MGERMEKGSYLVHNKIFQNIINALPVLLFWTDTNHILLGNNVLHAKNFGFSSPDELIGMTLRGIAENAGIDESLLTKFYLIHNEIMQSGKGRIVEYESVPSAIDGKAYPYLCHLEPLRDEYDKITGLIGISINVSELKQANIKAEAASQAKSEFIANMSHDLRTPMSGVLGMLEGLLLAARDAETALSIDKSANAKNPLRAALKELVVCTQEYTTLAKNSSNELINLFNEILEAIHLESGQIYAKPEAFDIRKSVQRNINILQSVAKDKSLHLSLTVSDKVPYYFNGLRCYLDRILTNLISNALKFTKQGSVKVDVGLSDKPLPDDLLGDSLMLRIQVKDTGIGIPEDKFDEIFEHFSRLTSSYEGVYKGSGLGLYTVKRYVEAIQGTIDVSSEVGKGTCFTLILPFLVSDHADRGKQSTRTPISIQPATEVELLKERGSVSDQDASASILIVEDNLIAAMAAKLAFKPFNCHIDMAESGAEAVAMVEKNGYDLILMDVGLPDFSGIEATQQIRALNDRSKAQVPIVALTGHADNAEIHQDAIDAGMQEILIKPLQRSALETILEAYVFQEKTKE